LTANSALEERAAALGRAFSGGVAQSPAAYTHLLVGVDFGVGPSYEVVIAGDSQAEDTRAMLVALREQFVPNKVVVLRPTEQELPEIVQLAEYTKYHSSIDGQATAYVCLDYICNYPTTDIDEMLATLEGDELLSD
jgi:uncharacterized protein YyaL (SSP411 family)